MKRKIFDGAFGGLAALVLSLPSNANAQVNPLPGYDYHSGVVHSLLWKGFGGRYFKKTIKRYLDTKGVLMDEEGKERTAEALSLGLIVGRELFDGVTSRKITMRDDKEGFSLLDAMWGAGGIFFNIKFNPEILGFRVKVFYYFDTARRGAATEMFYYDPSIAH